MTRIKSTAKTRAVELAAVRKVGGSNEQPHWLDRLEAVIKRRAKAENKAGKKPATR